MGYELQKSFAAGEISPLLHLRNDNEIHAEALRLMKNAIPTPQGPAEGRRGFEFVEELGGESQARIFDLDISFGESYVVAVTPNFVYIIDRNGFINGANIVTNPGFTGGGTGWSSDQTTFAGGTAILNPTPGNNARISQELTTGSPTNEHTIHVHGTGLSGGEAFTINIGTTEEGSDIDTIQGIGANFVGAFTPNTATFWITIDIAAGGNSKVIDSIDVFPSVTAGDIVRFVSPYTLQDIVELQVDKEPGNKVMFFFTRRVAPHELTFAGTNIWSFEEVIFDFGVDDNTDPNPPIWGDEFPGCITFYAGRMAVGGTFSVPIGIWLSKPRQYRNFDLGEAESQVADDALFLPLDKHGELVWLQGNKQLFAGLDSGEHVIFGEAGIIASNNAATEQHSTYGSSRIQTTIINEEVAYVDTRGRKVRLLDFDSNQQNMKSFDVSYIAEHITEGRIIEMDHGSSPFGALYFTTFDGRLITCHIEKDRGIYGWSQNDTDGFIQSVTIVREFGIDVPWIAVIRDNRLMLERIDITREIYSDSHQTIEEIVATTVFFGFNHLIGLDVQIMADNVVHPNVVVASDGSITLQFEANRVDAGLQYIPEIETLPQMQDLESGSTRSHIKRFSKVNVSLLDCPRPVINGQDTYRRDPLTTMGEREADKTEIVEITNSGWDDESVVNVSQPLPLKMVIAGIGGKLKSGKL